MPKGAKRTVRRSVHEPTRIPGHDGHARQATVTTGSSIDGVLVEWGERLFYPGNRIVKSRTPRQHATKERASAIRRRIEATVGRAPQVMGKVTGGVRGMAAIAAHFRYISQNGRLPIEEDRGVTEQGKDH